MVEVLRHKNAKPKKYINAYNVSPAYSLMKSGKNCWSDLARDAKPKMIVKVIRKM